MLLISDKHQFIFIHIRKAAGASINKLLKPLSNKQPRDLLSKLKSKSRLEKDYHKFNFQAHDDINIVKKIIPPEIFKSYFKFSFVRNPWARLVSEYEYIRKEKNHHRHKKVMKMDFQTYIRYQARRFDAHQINMLADRNCILLMDFIGKFENLNNDWGFVCEKIGIPFLLLPHENRNKQVDYRSYYSDDEKNLVKKLWQRDIEAFDYSFEE